MTDKELWILAELLILLPLSFYAATAIHELSHCVAVWAQGGRVLKFRVKWNMEGYIRYRDDKSIDSRPVDLAPFPVALALAAIFAALAFIHLPMLLPVVAEIEDALGWSYGYVFREPGSDGGDYRRLTEERRCGS